MRSLIVIAASVLIFSGGQMFAKTASCPCSPCKCSPCTCGGSGSKGGKHHDGHHGHDGGVGVGVNVDLGGVGQRKTEADPFAASGETTSHTTPDKPKKREKSAGKSDPFANVELTGARAKAAANP
jgi:hypothetical protein